MTNFLPKNNQTPRKAIHKKTNFEAKEKTKRENYKNYKKKKKLINGEGGKNQFLCFFEKQKARENPFQTKYYINSNECIVCLLL